MTKNSFFSPGPLIMQTAFNCNRPTHKMNKKIRFLQSNKVNEIIFGFSDVTETIGNVRMICVGTVPMLNSLWPCFFRLPCVFRYSPLIETHFAALIKILSLKIYAVGNEHIYLNTDPENKY